MISVYLDTYAWIDIARGWHGRNQDSQHKAVVNFLVDMASKQSIRFPLSHFHCWEMLKHEDTTWRTRLWGFAVDLSKCTGLLNRQFIQDDLIKRAVSHVFGISSVRKRLVPYTSSALFGLPLKRQLTFTDVLLRTPEGWKSFWLDMPEQTREQLFLGMKNLERSFIKRRNDLKSSWREEDYATRRRAYIAGLFLDYQESYLCAMYRICKRTREAIESLCMEDKLRLVTEVPTFNVEVALATQHLQQWDRSEDINDVRDIGHLCMAVPYCDIVVTERYWIDKIKREKLDERYQTLLLPDIYTLAKTLDN